MNELRIKIKEVFEKYEPTEILIYTHADHDGICASFGLNYLFGDIETKFSKPFRPKKIPMGYGKKLLIICDLYIRPYLIMDYLRKGVNVINFDHHDIVDIKHPNYLCIHPRNVFKKEFISSSGLIWKIFRQEKIAWILAAGSAGDLAVEDVKDLFEFVKSQHPELIKNTDLEGIYFSKIFEIAQIILMSFNTPEELFWLLKSSIKNDMGYKEIYKSKFYEKFVEKKEKISSWLEKGDFKKREYKNFVLIDTSNLEYSGSYSVFLNLKTKDKKIYIEYDNGRLFFRSYFGDEDIRNIAKIFNGGGPHSRSGGAYTRKTFEDVYKQIKKYYERYFQRGLNDFF